MYTFVLYSSRFKFRLYILRNNVALTNAIEMTEFWYQTKCRENVVQFSKQYQRLNTLNLIFSKHHKIKCRAAIFGQISAKKIRNKKQFFGS